MFVFFFFQELIVQKWYQNHFSQDLPVKFVYRNIGECICSVLFPRNNCATVLKSSIFDFGPFRKLFFGKTQKGLAYPTLNRKVTLLAGWFSGTYFPVLFSFSRNYGPKVLKSTLKSKNVPNSRTSVCAARFQLFFPQELLVPFCFLEVTFLGTISWNVFVFIYTGIYCHPSLSKKNVVFRCDFLPVLFLKRGQVLKLVCPEFLKWFLESLPIALYSSLCQMKPYVQLIKLSEGVPISLWENSANGEKFGNVTLCIDQKI